jgi:hypothetical protein
MPNQPTEETWRQKLALATLKGTVSGITGAVIAWLLSHCH